MTTIEQKIRSAMTREHIINSMQGCTITKQDVLRIVEHLLQCVPPSDDLLDSISKEEFRERYNTKLIARKGIYSGT